MSLGGWARLGYAAGPFVLTTYSTKTMIPLGPPTRSRPSQVIVSLAGTVVQRPRRRPRHQAVGTPRASI